MVRFIDFLCLLIFILCVCVFFFFRLLEEYSFASIRIVEIVQRHMRLSQPLYDAFHSTGRGEMFSKLSFISIRAKPVYGCILRSVLKSGSFCQSNIIRAFVIVAGSEDKETYQMVTSPYTHTTTTTTSSPTLFYIHFTSLFK
jgi:hypothetical protein